MSRLPRRGLLAALAARAVAGRLRVAVDAVVLLDWFGSSTTAADASAAAFTLPREFRMPDRDGAVRRLDADVVRRIEGEATATNLRYQVGSTTPRASAACGRRQHGLD